MLSRYICKRCKKENKDYIGGDWFESDERDWNGVMQVICPFAFGANVLISDEPPYECPYQLEHMMECEN